LEYAGKGRLHGLVGFWCFFDLISFEGEVEGAVAAGGGVFGRGVGGFGEGGWCDCGGVDRFMVHLGISHLNVLRLIDLIVSQPANIRVM